MIKKFYILIFVLISLDSYCSRRDTNSFKNSFAINIESLIFRDFKITNTHRINKSTYFETTLSYNIPYYQYSNFVSLLDLYNFRDPFYYYGRIQLRLGIKRYEIKQNSVRRFYAEPMLLYNYGHFYKEDVYLYKNDDLWEEVTRNKSDIEILIKLGWTFHGKHYLEDLYFGTGLRMKFFSDEVYDYEIGDTGAILPHPPYPFHSNHHYSALEFHLGYQIGYCK